MQKCELQIRLFETAILLVAIIQTVLCQANLALNRPAIQSGDYIVGGFAAVAGLAVDGNNNTDFNNRSCAHTETHDKAWWGVDLGQIYNLESVAITRRVAIRQFHEHRLANFKIEVSEEREDNGALINPRLCSERIDDPPRLGKRTSFTCSRGATGRYVRFQLQDENFISMCEVEIFGSVVDSRTKSDLVPKTTELTETTTTTRTTTSETATLSSPQITPDDLNTPSTDQTKVRETAPVDLTKTSVVDSRTKTDLVPKTTELTETTRTTRTTTSETTTLSSPQIRPDDLNTHITDQVRETAPVDLTTTGVVDSRTKSDLVPKTTELTETTTTTRTTTSETTTLSSPQITSDDLNTPSTDQVRETAPVDLTTTGFFVRLRDDQGKKLKAEAQFSLERQSATACAMECAQHSSCAVFNYNKLRLTCKGYPSHDVLTDGREHEDGWGIWEEV